MQFWTVDELPEALGPASAPGTEIAPGVRIQRRAMLRLGAQFAGLAALGGLVGCSPKPRESLPGLHSGVSPPQAPPPPEPQPLTVGEFVRQVRPQAKDLIRAATPDEEAYLQAAGDLLKELGAVDRWRRPRPNSPFSMDTTAAVPPIVLFRIDMQPGATIPIHDHRHYNGVILCMEGSLRCRNFDIVVDPENPLDIAAGEVPPKGTDFVIRQTVDEVIGPGERSSLTRARDNIHEVTAGDEGCVLMDLFTHFQPGARSYPIKWDDKPFDEAAQLYHARWG